MAIFIYLAILPRKLLRMACLHTRLKLADDNGNLLNRKNSFLASFFRDL